MDNNMRGILSSVEATDKFCGEGFFLWQKKILRLADASGLTTYLESSANGACETEMKARAFLQQRLHDDVLSQIVDCDTAHDMWTSLATMYAENDIQSVMQIETKLRTMEMSESESVAQHIGKFRSLAAQLRNCGGSLASNTLNGYLVNSYIGIISRIFHQIGNQKRNPHILGTFFDLVCQSRMVLSAQTAYG